MKSPLRLTCCFIAHSAWYVPRQTLDAVNAAVEVLTRTVQELFQETGVVSRSVYSAFAAYRVCQNCTTIRSVTFAGILRWSNCDHVYPERRKYRKRRDATLVQG